ncbi:PD40 domain-containing protein [Perlabentimonas gracilis]|uniref:PD40 domain-containing protein n=1 Tax=Perlabentimonas gracilis TaxID=2715279 RepID=UPI00140BEC7B|nr:PD40 domain-containing protein [Perlabentimonas gracilis]
MIYQRELEAEEFLIDKQYERAAKKYEDALKLIPTSANLKFKVGSVYLLTPTKKHLALNYLKEAAKGASTEFNPRAIKEEAAPIDAWYQLGRALQMDNQFTEAISAFEKFKSLLDPSDPFVTNVNKRIESCRNAPQLMADEQGLETINLGNIINSKDANFNAVVSGDGTTLAYTRQGNRGYEVYVAKRKGDAWERPRRITDDIRGGFLKTASLSYDGTWLYLVDDFASTQSIYDTFYDEGWVRSKRLKKPITSKFNESHAAVSPDGKTLYFTSDRPGGRGGLDIYKSSQDSRGRWGDPVNLGPRVNTELDEDTPFLTPDGRYLFFSSQGHNSMGGFDIFYVDLNGSGEPINLGYPVNDAGDNLFYYPQSLTKGLMALSQSDGFGPQDIYELQITPLVTLNGNLAVVDNQSAPADEQVRVEIIDLQSTDMIAQISASLTDKSFTKRLRPGDYLVQAKANGFEDFEMNFTIAATQAPQDLNISLIPIPQEPEPESLLAMQQDIEEEIIQLEPEPKHLDPSAGSGNRELSESPQSIQSQPELKPQPQPKAQPVRSFVVETLPTEGYYTVQFMALLVPVPESHFQNIDGVLVTQGADGYHRYSVGAVATRGEAQVIQQQLRGLGYSESFIKYSNSSQAKAAQKIEYESQFTIQVMALRSPADMSRFSNLPDVKVEQGDDSFYRYYTGNYSSHQQASDDLPRIERIGYKGAFVRKL